VQFLNLHPHIEVGGGQSNEEEREKRRHGMSGLRNLRFVLFVVSVATIHWLLIYPTQATAQNPGNNTVYDNSGNRAPSTAFIDASVFATTGSDFCQTINSVLTNVHYPALGAVIDARGVPYFPGVSMTCTSSPWAGLTIPPPTTILLPAGVIMIPSTWVLPNNTRLIGEGDGTPPLSSAFNPGTTIQVTSAFASGNTMIQFGSSTTCPSVSGINVCTGISVENLTLDGQGQSVYGVVNQYSQDASYVDHVGLYQILGTGLEVGGIANNSGPYSNISFDTGTHSGASSTVCAQILNVTQNGTISGGTRGLHGLSCISESHDASAAVLLDSSNNSIEDVQIQGFYDGVLVGSNGAAQSNVLINIIGDTGPAPTPVNAVHISSGTVTDLVIMGISHSGVSGTFSLRDDLTGISLPDTTVALYALGESVNVGSSANGYSRFTTSPNAPTWASGSGNPPASPACSRGSLYSCVGGMSGCSFALWSCTWNGTTSQWTGVH
jgi:hypothetical protein